MNKLTCIYHEAGGSTECGVTPEDIAQNGQNDLVRMQEHLRDEHLHCSTDELQQQLARCFRMVWQPHTSQITLLQPYEVWDPARHEPYTKIEWHMHDGSPWLRAESTPDD